MPGLRPAVEAVAIAPGESLLMFTDGVTECRGADGEFGEARLLAVLSLDAATASDLAGALRTALSVHAGDCAAHDDLTVLCLMREA